MFIIKKETKKNIILEKNNNIIITYDETEAADQDQDAIQWELFSRLYNREPFQEIAGDLFDTESGDGFRFTETSATGARSCCEIITTYIIKEDAEMGACLNW